ncbi:MAG: hypothetical protein HZB61_11590 [Nitrospirae bacterium]|nr:hypothetical protein [Nitrospirota bacterium]
MTCLEISLKLFYCERSDFDRLTAEADEIAAMIAGFARSL